MAEDSNTANKNFPIRIERYGWGCLMIVALSIVCLAWILFMFFVIQ
ncbi:MAG: hypothetical protein Q8M29_18585 [Bacteroidota bacterium]|nr:hypothetical protein [Bacteroidota bacterium]